MAEKIEIHSVNKKYEKRVEDSNILKIEKKYLIDFLDQCQLGKINRGRKLSIRRLHKYIDFLIPPLEYWGKDVKKITSKDIEKYDRDLTSDKIKKKNGGSFASETKADIRRAIKLYFKWRLGEAKAIDLVGWFDTRFQKKTPNFLSEKEAELLYRSCRNERERYMVAVLFDTGARATEFFNIRFEDITMPSDSTKFIKINLKEEYSKTKGRNISLYWRYSSEAIRDYLRLRKQEGIKSNEPIYDGDYNQARAFLRRLGASKLKKRIYFHLFRHSSATHYASKMNRQELCIRYGWRFSSDMPDVYISRAGMTDKELDDRMAGTEVEKVKDDFFKKEQEFKMEMENLRNEMERKQKETNEAIKGLINHDLSKMNKEVVEAYVKRREVKNE